jgi:hypothetical protein
MIGVINFECHDRCVAVPAMGSVVQTTDSTEYIPSCTHDKYCAGRYNPPPEKPRTSFTVFHKYKHSFQIKQYVYTEHYYTLLLLLFNFEYPLTY